MSLAEVLSVLGVPALAGGPAYRIALSPAFHRFVVVTARDGACEIIASRNAPSIALGRRGVRGFSATEECERIEDIVEIGDVSATCAQLVAIVPAIVNARDGCGFVVEVFPGVRIEGELPDATIARVIAEVSALPWRAEIRDELAQLARDTVTR